MNGVSEALLEDLLSQSRAQTQLLQRLVRAWTGSSGQTNTGGGGATPTQSFPSFGPLSAVTKLVTGALGLLGTVACGLWKIFGSLAGVVTGLVKSMFEFGQKSLDAGAKMSDFLDMFSGSPIIGKLFSIGASLQRIQESILEGYRNISQIGATFGGSYMAVFNAAARSGLTLTEFSDVVKNNAQIFSMMGGTVQTGLNRFSSSVRQLLSPDSVTGMSVLGLGVGFKEAANYLGSYMATLVRTSDLEKMTTEEIAAAGREYIFQIDALARLTGEDRKQIEQRMRAAMVDQNFQAYLSGLNKEQAAVAAAFVQTFSGINEEMGQQAKATIMGFTGPVNEFGRSLAATNSTFMIDVGAFRRAMNSGMTAQEASQRALRMAAEVGLNQSRFMRNSSEIVAGGYIKLNPAITGFGNRIDELRKKGKTFEEILEIVGREQAAASTGSAAAMAQQELAARDLSAQINAVFMQIGAMLLPYLRSFAFILRDLILPIFKSLGPYIRDFLSWIKELTTMKPADAFKKAFDDISKKAGELWTAIKEPVMEAFGKLTNFLKPFFNEILINLRYELEKFIDEQFGGIDAKEEEFRRTRRDVDLAKSRLDRAPVDAREQRNAQLELVRALEARMSVLLRYKEYGEVPSIADALKALKVHTSQRLPPAEPKPKESEPRHSGTIGMTGNWWEKESGTLNVQAGETVLTQSQLSQIVDTAGQNNLAVEVRKLNNLTAQMLVYLKQTADNTKDSVRATKSLNGNLLEAV